MIRFSAVPRNVINERTQDFKSQVIMKKIYILPFLVYAFLIAPVALGQIADDKPVAPRLYNLGEYHHKITTDVQDAQIFFDQGLILAYAFNHAEAYRSFKEAARLDPSCAMCYWGQALVLGPNINAGMDPEDVPEAYAAVRQALELSPGASEKEQAFIQALAKRYQAEAVEDRSRLDAAYAKAMAEVAARYPDDDEAATLYAEALMDTTPWDYWENDTTPNKTAQRFMAILERVMDRTPKHPGANHLYIHAVEEKRPELGIAAADRLGDIAPGAGHLVHMPSHIYIRVGRYHEASLANLLAIEADDAYLTQCRQQGLYPLGYMPHNHHFLWAAATFEGRSEMAMSAAEHIASKTDQKMMRMPGMAALQHFFVAPLFAEVRFGKWQEILARPEPAKDLVYPRSIWLYARGIAFVRTDRIGQAEKALTKLSELAKDKSMESMRIWGLNTTSSIAAIALKVLESEVSAAKGDIESAIDRLYEAVEMEDALVYTEPADWHQPVRQLLGAMLLKCNKAAEAEKIYRDDLVIYPVNGWSLFGLRASLLAQGKMDEAREVKAQFDEAWKNADIKLSGSAY